MNRTPHPQHPFARVLGCWRHTQTLGTLILLIGFLSISFWIRIQGVDVIPDGQFTGTDAYLYYWQAQRIAEDGQLPERDMHRWLPLGRDLGQTLNLYSYALAYTHKAIVSVFPHITLYHVALYAPVVCFCLALGALCLFLYHTRGGFFTLGVGVLLAILPGTLERSSAGFSDRDAWCFLIGILSVTTYLVSLQTDAPRKRLIWTLLSGFIVFLGGLSWEGFGVFLSVIIVVELWRFLTTETEEGLGLYAVWVCCFVPTLSLASPAYRNGYGFAEHLFAFVLIPPLVLLAIRTLRHLLLSKVDRLHSHARTLSLGFTLASISMGLGYVWIQRHVFVETTVLFSESTLMQTVGELNAPRLKYWIIRYGSVFILGSIGVIIASKKITHRGFMLTPLILFTFATFFREILEKYLWDASHNTQFFALVIIYCAIAFLLTAVRQKSQGLHTTHIVAFTAWFLIWGALARDARRYDIFLAVPLAFFSMEAIKEITHCLSQKIWQSKYISDIFRKDVPTPRLQNSIALAMLALILFWPTTGGHTLRAYKNTAPMRSALPGDLPVAKALEWMKAELPHTAVVAARWRYGSLLNVLGGVKTIIDQDHYIQHWIHLYDQYIKKGHHPQDALAFLKTHQATHLMITRKHPPPSVKNASKNKVFLPVYPTQNFEKSMVKIWEIHYPPNIKADPKYLKTGFPEIDKTLGLP